MNEEIKQKILKAGKIAAQVRREGAAKFVIGAKALDVMDFCEKRILELGGGIAWAQMAINEVAAHYCPKENDETTLKEGDLVKIDIGVHIDGYIADNAMTVEVGNLGKWTDLIEASKNALREAIAKVKPGVQLWELGKAQMDEAQKKGFTTVRNLSGHTIEPYVVHAGVSIPSFDSGNKAVLEEGWQIAIEPFVTNGDGLIREGSDSTIFMVQNLKGVRSPFARKILDFVKLQNGLPFTERWITRKFGRGSLLGMRELLQKEIVKSYPPLVEVSGGMVAQFEHSMIVTKDGALVYTRHPDDDW